MSAQLQSFQDAELLDGCIVSTNSNLLPYPSEETQKLFVRKCYLDCFNLILKKISQKRKFFGISGTPGIGKSLFFVYILFRILKDKSWKPLRIVYHQQNTFLLFDLKNFTVTDITQHESTSHIRENDTLYIIDGQKSTPLLVCACTTIFISSPRSDDYKSYLKQKKAKEWCFPTWAIDELLSCKQQCYSTLPDVSFKERYSIYGGVARFVFAEGQTMPDKMDKVLADVNAVACVKNIGSPSDLYQDFHTLLHMLVDNSYKFTEFDIASKYVGEKLWEKHASQMVTNLQALFGGSPNEISRHLFEIYGHIIFSKGDKTFKCRNLEIVILILTYGWRFSLRFLSQKVRRKTYYIWEK
jgi:hypothetical protein